MVKYEFADGPVRIMNAKRANPQRIGEAFAKAGWDKRAIYQDAESNPRHPVHKHLEWDDAKAGKAHRMEQISELFRIILVRDEAVSSGPVRAALSVNTGRGHKYHSIQDVVGSVELMDAVLKQADRDLQAFEERFQQLQDVCKIVAAAREAVAKKRAGLGGKGKEQETRATA